ncbi:MAG TPA: nucleotidyl transferase AbiEii/AbiGii toxin family protein [Thermoguttaceae bacterium]|nr:nucleotidyl transferase AbiEii/AbiGii toxin family protein [Thermoguttaceae bacterium]
MDDFARLPSDERRLYFEQAAASRNLRAQLIEKDFWVCWTLRRLFTLDEFRDHLTFKGGTSLSKVFHVIERFSEDVDVAIERSFLGFGGEMEPERGTSGKEQQRRIEELKKACQAAIRERLEPQLRDAIATHLGDGIGWSLTRDPTDPDDQTLLFEYPSAVTTNLSPNFAQSIKIELGARSDHFPVDNATLRPYVSDTNALDDDITQVRVLGAERTFWEKATILHMLHYLPDQKTLAPNMSRHYYDVFQLSNSPIFERAMASIHLLSRVAKHKSVFFKAAWAKYDQARPGTLRLIPGQAILAPLKRDYDSMEPMFFGTPPSLREILARLPELEDRINRTAE